MIDCLRRELYFGQVKGCRPPGCHRLGVNDVASSDCQGMPHHWAIQGCSKGSYYCGPPKGKSNDHNKSCCLSYVGCKVWQWSISSQPTACARPTTNSNVVAKNSLCFCFKQLVVHLQAVSSRNKQPRLSIVKNLLKRLKPGRLRGSFVANDCTISPVLFSKGLYMTVRPLPVMTASSARRHQ